MTLLGALGLTGLDALMTVAGVTDGEGLHALVEQVLGATLWPGDIVVIDNLGAHKVAPAMAVGAPIIVRCSNTALSHSIASAMVRASATLSSNSRSCAKSGN